MLIERSHFHTASPEAKQTQTEVAGRFSYIPARTTSLAVKSMLVGCRGEAPGIGWAANHRPRRIVRESGLPQFQQIRNLHNPARKRSIMTPEEVSNIAAELKRLGTELNLSDSQREQLRNFLTEKYEQLQEYKKQNPNVSKEDIAKYIAKNRDAGRDKIQKFLTPEQLKTWDAEVAKAKDFLSQRAASA